jgi:prophage regulatory protein
MSTIERFIRLPEVMNTVGLKKSAIYKKVKEGDFPAPIKLGPHANGWLESAVQGWIRKQAGIPANDEHREAA